MKFLPCLQEVSSQQVELNYWWIKERKRPTIIPGFFWVHAQAERSKCKNEMSSSLLCDVIGESISEMPQMSMRTWESLGTQEGLVLVTKANGRTVLTGGFFKRQLTAFCIGVTQKLPLNAWRAHRTEKRCCRNRLFITPYSQISQNLQKLLSSIGLKFSNMDGSRECPAK